MDKEIRVLIVGESVPDAERIARELKKGDLPNTAKRVKPGDDFFEALEAYHPDIILCDSLTPPVDAPAVLKIVKERCPKTPFLVVSGAIGEDVAVELVKSGAADYVVKDRLARLLPAVKRALDEFGSNGARKEISADPRASSDYARKLIETSLDPLVTISAEGMITDVNEATVKITGVSRDRLIGTDFSDYFTEPEKAREGYRKVFASGAVTDYPLTVRHISGHVTEVLYNASVYRDSSGKVLGVFAARDVTESRRAEDALRQGEEKYRQLHESMTDAFVSVDMAGQILAGC